ncbi:hypothetical protein KDX30_19830 [Pseudomonas sp. CDFA 553]|uniref:hypothetical protein n=1 Tax=Pseudomonas quasicaspiana TaxID=2829821 RepID=UPI001E5BE07E|nr:hypothetical protein [Pseudomonas quasicaspiana]MCD5990142.1 hypothetical protein [Pseudomonas quasicaspiana]
MLDRTKIEGSYRESVVSECAVLTDLEVSLIQLYRQMSQHNQKQIRRIAGCLADPSDAE